MSFNGTESEFVGLADAQDFTKRYRTASPGELRAHFFGREKLLALLNQNGCEGLRIYYGLNSDNEKVLVVVGAGRDENDQVDSNSNEQCLEMGIPCPSRCSSVGGL